MFSLPRSSEDRWTGAKLHLLVVGEQTGQSDGPVSPVVGLEGSAKGCRRSFHALESSFLNAVSSGTIIQWNATEPACRCNA